MIIYFFFLGDITITIMVQFAALNARHSFVDAKGVETNWDSNFRDTNVFLALIIVLFITKTTKNV